MKISAKGLRPHLFHVVALPFDVVITKICCSLEDLYAALWRTKSPKKVGVLSWILINGKVNMANILQKKLPTLALSPSICVLCAASGECQLHVFFQCSLAAACWELLFHHFSISWAFDVDVPKNILQLLCGPRLSPKA